MHREKPSELPSAVYSEVFRALGVARERFAKASGNHGTYVGFLGATRFQPQVCCDGPHGA